MLPSLQKFYPNLDFSLILQLFHPALALSHPIVVELEKKGILVIGDIELAWRLRDKHDVVAKWIGVTGTNGKTTTSEMTAAMLWSPAKE